MHIKIKNPAVEKVLFACSILFMLFFFDAGVLANDYCLDPEKPVECTDDSVTGFDLWWCCPDGYTCGTMTEPCNESQSSTTTVPGETGTTTTAVDTEFLWKQVINGSASKSDDEASSIAIDENDNILIAGFSEPAGSGRDFTVIKLNGYTGDVIWQDLIQGSSAQGDNEAKAVVTDSGGSVFAAGFLSESGSGQAFTVLKLNGDDGSEIWKQLLNGNPEEANDKALALTLDSEDNVVSGGYLANGSTGSYYTVVKLKGSTGKILWEETFDSPSENNNAVFDVIVDKDNHVISAGQMGNGYGGSWITVMKLNGSTGRTIWQKDIWGGDLRKSWAADIVLDHEENIIVAGTLAYSGGINSFAVIKLRGKDGEQIWAKDFFGSDLSGYNCAEGVVVDDQNNIFAAGVTKDLGGYRFALMKLNGNDGSKIWPSGLSNSPLPYVTASATGLVLNEKKDLFAVGQIPCSETMNYAFAVCVFDPGTGELLREETIPGTAALVDFSTGTAAAVDSSGNPVAAGVVTSEDTGNDIVAVKIGLYDDTGIFPGTTTTTVEEDNPEEPNEGQCFIETVYKGSLSEEIMLLRYFRDSVLLKSPAGRQLVKLYYFLSPALSRFAEQNKRFEHDAKDILDSIVCFVRLSQDVR